MSDEVENTAATPEENVAAPVENTQDQPEVKTEAPKLVSMTQEEFDKKIQGEKAKAEAKAERRYLKQQRELLERFVPKPEPVKTETGNAPKLAEYPDFETYLEARDAWNEKRLESKFRDEAQKTVKQTSVEAEQAKLDQGWREKVSKAVKEFPDIQEVLSDSEVVMTPAMEMAIRDADNGPRIARHLALNPEEAERIAQMSPVRQAAAILKMDEAPVKVSTAPEPLTPVGGNRGIGSKDPSEMTDKEFAAWRKKQIQSRS